MSSEAIKIETTDDAPLTVGAVAKWAAIVGAAAAALVGITLYVAAMQARTAALEQGQKYQDEQTATIKAMHEARLAALEADRQTTQRTLAELNTKLESMIVIVQRIDAKVGHP